MTQILIAARGGHFSVKLVAHHTNPDLVVIKSKHPEAGAMLAVFAGIEASALVSEKGSLYFRTIVERKALEAGIGRAIFGAMDGALAVSAPASHKVYNDLEAANEPEEEEDDEDDGDEN